MTAAGQKTAPKAIFVVSFMNKAGAQRAAHRVAAGLAARGWQTELWFLYREVEDHYAGVPVRILLDTDRPGAKGYLRIFARLVSMLRAAKPDAVVSFLPLGSVFGQCAAFLAGVPQRVASQRSPMDTFSGPMRRLDRLFGTFGIYSRIVAVSGAVAASADGYPERYRRRITVVHNGVDMAPSRLSKAEARARLGLPEDAFVALSIGRMKPQKNYFFQLDIAERLERAKIAVIGDGYLRDEIEAEIARRGLSDRILLLGALPSGEIPDAYRAADLFMQPSLFEGQSNTLLEAMSQALPVLVSDVPSQTETTRGADGTEYGLALPLDDPGVWAETLDALAADPERCETLSDQAARRARDFTVPRQIDGFEAVLTEDATCSKTPPATSSLNA